MPKEYLQEISSIEHSLPQGGVIYYDDFSPPIRFVAVGSHADYVCELSREIVLHGKYSLLLKSPAVGGAGRYVYATSYIPIYGKGIVDVQITFTQGVANAVTGLATYLYFADPDLNYIAGTRYDFVNNKWQYYSSSGWTDISGASQNLAEVYWHAANWGINLSTWKYTQLRCEDDVFNLSSLSPDTSSGAARGSFLSIYAYDISGSQAYAYIDSILITQRGV